jgi:hypothetical protein
MSDETPYEDPFSDQVNQDPFEDNQFANGGRTGGNDYDRDPIPVNNATAVLVLGILSIVGSFCYGVLGLILGIIALAIAAGPTRQYRQDPQRYTDSSYSTLKAGKICGIIGLVLSLVVIVVFVLFFLLVAAKANEPFYYQNF